MCLGCRLIGNLLRNIYIYIDIDIDIDIDTYIYIDVYIYIFSAHLLPLHTAIVLFDILQSSSSVLCLLPAWNVLVLDTGKGVETHLRCTLGSGKSEKGLGFWRGGHKGTMGGTKGSSLQTTWDRGGRFLSQLEGAK